jgi:hypothetical protein
LPFEINFLVCSFRFSKKCRKSHSKQIGCLARSCILGTNKGKGIFVNRGFCLVLLKYGIGEKNIAKVGDQLLNI